MSDEIATKVRNQVMERGSSMTMGSAIPAETTTTTASASISASASALAATSAGATALTRFYIPDTSPVIEYGDGVQSSWAAGYAMQANGFDQTLHTTTVEERLAFNISATTMTLMIPWFDGCQATLSINDSSPIPACASASASASSASGASASTTASVSASSATASGSGSGSVPFSLYNLPSGVHRVVWNTGAIEPGQQVVFWGVDAQRPLRSGVTNVTVDDAYVSSSSSSSGASGSADGDQGIGVGWTFGGYWRHVEGGGGDGDEQDAVKGFNRTLAMSDKQGASVVFTGTGSGMYVYGPVGPSYGSASVALDGQVVAPHVNLTSPWSMPYQLIWYSDSLDPSINHNLTLTNLAQDQSLGIDFVILTVDSHLLAKLSTYMGYCNNSPGWPDVENVAHREKIANGSNQQDDKGFLHTLGGRVTVYALIPILAIIVCSLGVILHIRGRNQNGQRARDGARGRSRASCFGRTLRKGGRETEYGIHSHPVSVGSSRSRKGTNPSGPYESGAGGGGGVAEKRWSRGSEESFSVRGDLYASHEDRGYAPGPSSRPSSQSPSSRRAGPLGRAYPQIQAHSAFTLPRDGSEELGTVEANGTGTNATEGGFSSMRTLRSILGSSYARSSVSQSQARRATNLPPYTLGANGTLLSEDLDDLGGTFREAYPGAAAEKAAQLVYMREKVDRQSAGPSSQRDDLLNQTRVGERESTVAPSEVLSVYGQPPSERRESAMTTYSSVAQPFAGYPSLPLPAIPRSTVRPTVDTNVHRSTSPTSASTQQGSAAPLLRSPEKWSDSPAASVASAGHGSVGRDFTPKRMWSGVALSTLSDASAATAEGSTRPDSDILPYEPFSGRH